MTFDDSLCAVPYRITALDGQVIFAENSGFHGVFQFTFEWKGCGWYLVHTESDHECIYVPQIVAAMEWLNANTTTQWKNGTGTIIFNQSKAP